MRRRINLDIEERGFAWQCATSPQEQKYRAPRATDKKPCGHWNSYFGRKWAMSTKRGTLDPKWDAKCEKCGKKKMLAPEKMHDAPNYVDSREKAIALAKELNDDALHQAERAQAIKHQHQLVGPSI